MNDRVKLLLPSFADIVFLSIFLLLAFNSGSHLLNDGDTAHHIRIGQLILEHRTVPKRDMFSFLTPPLDWTVHEWLSQIIMALTFDSYGFTGVVILFSLIIALTYFTLFKALLQDSGDVILSAGVTWLAAISSSLHWLARPHLFSLALTVIWYHLLDNFQYKNLNRLLLLPALMIVWVNLHGAFILGFIILGIYLMGNLVDWGFSDPGSAGEKCLSKAKILTVITVGCVAVAGVNPHGFHILLFPFKVISNSYISEFVMEYHSPNFHDPDPFKYLLLILIGALALSRVPLKTIEIGLIVLFTYMALYAVRYIPLFAIITAPILLKATKEIVERTQWGVVRFLRERAANLTRIDRATRGHFWPILGVIAVLLSAATGRIKFDLDEKRFPVAAVEFLKREFIPGNMFNNDEFGDYIIFAAWPRYKVFADGRADMYGSEWGKDYMKVAYLQTGWEEIMRKYDISWVIYNTHSSLSSVLRDRTDWHLLYADHVASIFVKKDPKYERLIEKYSKANPPPADK